MIRINPTRAASAHSQVILTSCGATAETALAAYESVRSAVKRNADIDDLHVFEQAAAMKRKHRAFPQLTAGFGQPLFNQLLESIVDSRRIAFVAPNAYVPVAFL